MLNFKRIKELTMSFNKIIGDNKSGKGAILLGFDTVLNEGKKTMKKYRCKGSV
jgi:predicted ATP-dependent endonuclease of OLD family